MRTILYLVLSLMLGFQQGAAAINLSGYSPQTVKFGGDGSDGDLVISSNTVQSTTIFKQYKSITVNSGVTWTLHAHSMILCRGNVSIVGTLASSPDIRGGTVGSTSEGIGVASGPSPGANGIDQAGGGGGSGGGGGGCYGAGGGGGSQFGGPGHGGQGGGATSGVAPLDGSGGGAGGSHFSSGGIGGNGAGKVTICAGGTITISGGIISSGIAGATVGGTGGGGAGGSGGPVFLYSSKAITNSGTFTANGGAGGNGAYGGGGGGAGCLIGVSPANSFGTVTVNGGAHGVGSGSSPNGVDGGAGGSINLTGTPGLPLIGMLERHARQILTANQTNQVRMTTEQLIALADNDHFDRDVANGVTGHTCEYDKKEPDQCVA